MTKKEDIRPEAHIYAPDARTMAKVWVDKYGTAKSALDVMHAHGGAARWVGADVDHELRKLAWLEIYGN